MLIPQRKALRARVHGLTARMDSTQRILRHEAGAHAPATSKMIRLNAITAQRGIAVALPRLVVADVAGRKARPTRWIMAMGQPVADVLPRGVLQIDVHL
jgi:hypothetical protein